MRPSSLDAAALWHHLKSFLAIIGIVALLDRLRK